MNATDKVAELLRLHTDPELLVLVNVWDVASARVVTGQPGCKALATASAAIAATQTSLVTHATWPSPQF